jgi:phosphatidylethanolamine/phosphatidyl-N-methylethanolamine N-methyltransferase
LNRKRPQSEIETTRGDSNSALSSEILRNLLMSEATAFLKAFLENPTSVGSVFPSSPAVAARMIKNIKPGKDSVVLELGCGTGPFTEAIAKILPSPDCYLGIEINEEMVTILREKFPSLNIVCADASQVGEIHQNLGLGPVKYIVSGLPFASLPEEVSQLVLTEVDKFMQRGGCEFRTIQYAISTPLPLAKEFRRMMNKKYGRAHRSRLIWKNLPPTFIYTWRN